MKKELSFIENTNRVFFAAGVVLLIIGLTEMISIPEWVSILIEAVGLVFLIYAIYLLKKPHEQSDEMGDEHLQYAGSMAFSKMGLLMILICFIPDRLFEMVPQLMNVSAWMHILIGVGLLYFLYVFNKLEQEC